MGFKKDRLAECGAIDFRNHASDGVIIIKFGKKYQQEKQDNCDPCNLVLDEAPLIVINPAAYVLKCEDEESP